MDITKQHHVLIILCRVSEPSFVPKNPSRLAFDVLNNDLLAPQFLERRKELQEKYSKEVRVLVPLKEIHTPDLSEVMQLGREDSFSIFHPHHQKMLEKLLEIFMSASNYDRFLSAAVYARDTVNPFMFVYAYCIAVIHRPETKGLQLPPLHEIFPDKFLDGSLVSTAVEHANVLTAGQHGQRRTKEVIIPKDYTASDLDPEHRVAYFREDIGINLHHWHWHLVYPFGGPLKVVNKDRRGELFYYMHRQIIARYDCERLCNRLGRVKRLMDLRKPISEGYFPKLYNTIAGRTWASRSPGAMLSDVNRKDFKYDLDDMERWKSRIIEAIHLKRVIDKEGQIVSLAGTDGIDILGNMVESSRLLSKNYDYYGELHNYGHVAISVCHDPDGRYQEEMGVMGDNTTAMRDPMFYRWHSFIDYIFETHKNTLPPYQPSELHYSGINIEKIIVQTAHESCINVLKTFWQEKNIAMTCGLDFTNHLPIYARITRLQHRSFHYKIQVKNLTNNICTGTVRIFLAPKYDEKGKSMLFIDQRRLFIELDKFQFKFSKHPQMNVIERASEDSYVTNRMETSFKNIEESLSDPNKSYKDFCGCGWPDNMLIPKGSAEGFQCQLLVMISNAEHDLVDSPVDGTCSEASSYCGVRDKKYPDKRPMGFPFDRLTTDEQDTLEKFVERSPNMAIQDVTIIFEGGKVTKRKDVPVMSPY